MGSPGARFPRGAVQHPQHLHPALSADVNGAVAVRSI